MSGDEKLTEADKAKGDQAKWLAKNVTDGKTHERPTGEKTKSRKK